METSGQLTNTSLPTFWRGGGQLGWAGGRSSLGSGDRDGPGGGADGGGGGCVGGDGAKRWGGHPAEGGCFGGERGGPARHVGDPLLLQLPEVVLDDLLTLEGETGGGVELQSDEGVRVVSLAFTYLFQPIACLEERGL